MDTGGSFPRPREPNEQIMNRDVLEVFQMGRQGGNAFPQSKNGKTSHILQ
jgi:hypothetical protein